MATGAPLALGVALAMPGLWTVGVVWIVLIAGLMLADAMLAAPQRRMTLTTSAPLVMGIGRPAGATLTAAFTGRTGHRGQRATGRRT